ncbi:MAG: SEC-C domain-containing protein [Lentisphaeria bacterium]|nr:SEC-C domain-containing protein [Lentisphaeria bacterium]
MDLKERWKTYCENTPETSDAGFGELLDDILAAPEAERPFAAIRGMTREALATAIGKLGDGGVHGVGVLPQLELCVLAALRHLGAGRKVFIVAPTPVAPSLSRSLIRFLVNQIGVSTEASGVIFGKPAARLKSVLNADVIFTDLIQIFEAFHKDPDLIEGTESALLLCEADLCLYDARLGLFDRGHLQAVAAIYRSTGKGEPWKSEDNTIDLVDCLEKFQFVGGALSYTTTRVRREMRRVYGSLFPGGVHGKSGAGFTSFAFRTWKEKLDTLCRDIVRTEGDGLVFLISDMLRQSLTAELKKRGQEAIFIDNPRDLRTYLSMESDGKKRVALYRGIPTLMNVPLESRARINVFLGDHLILAHQHQKIRAFIDKELDHPKRPALYFCLEDEMFNVYAEEGNFGRLFDVIEFTERYDKWRQVRRVMGQAILQRIYALRNSCLDEDHPIFTLVGAARTASRKKESKSRKKIGKRLEGLCFCGSGKPFKECHGKPKS